MSCQCGTPLPSNKDSLEYAPINMAFKKKRKPFTSFEKLLVVLSLIIVYLLTRK